MGDVVVDLVNSMLDLLIRGGGDGKAHDEVQSSSFGNWLSSGT